MARKKRYRSNWRDWLGLIPITIAVCLVSFVVTKHEWFDLISRDNKALFWTSLVTGLATLGLLVVAVVAAVVAWRQFREFQRGAKIQTTTDLLREWADDKYQRIIRFVDFGPDAATCRKYARLLYVIVSSDVQRPPKRERQKRKKWRDREDFVDGTIQDFALMATRTWNLLEHGIIDEGVLFGQLDYDIVAMYYELEDVLAIRSYREDQLYSEFTRLAQRAQAHYLKRAPREIVDDFIEARFDPLPSEDDEFERYMEMVRDRDRVERELAYEEAQEELEEDELRSS